MTRYNPVIAKLDAWQVTTVDQVRSTLTALVTSRLRWQDGVAALREQLAENSAFANFGGPKALDGVVSVLKA